MKRRLKLLLIDLSLIFICLSILESTDAYYSVYLLIGILGAICSYINYKKPIKKNWLEYTFSVLLATLITMANYQIYESLPHLNEFTQALMSFLSALLVFAGSFIIFINILSYAKTFIIKTNSKLAKSDRPIKIFLFYFVVFFFIDLTIFLLCYFPGNLTSDSIDEIGQLLSNTYTNHHPFYFTLLIKFFVSIGIRWFSSINVGVALFSIFQIMVLSSAFSYSLLTLRQIGVSKKIILTTLVILAIMPYNIIYSFTVWKDILFAAFFLIFIVSIYRYLHKLTNHKKSLLFLITLCGIILCLFRSNAWIAFGIATIIFFIIFKKKYLSLGFIFCAIIGVSFILKNPVLKILSIPQPDIIESLSIPTQQIARTLSESKDTISTNDLSLIDKLADSEEIIKAYSPIIHDPIKKVIRSKGTVKNISEHKAEYLLLYLRLGLTHPAQYLKAWIDQTKGYWNAGYNYWRWSEEIAANNYGIERHIISNEIKSAFSSYLFIFENTNFLTPFISIGIAVWLLIILLYVNIIRKNETIIIFIIFILATWGTLLIATPVFSEFRYIYFLFTCLPFLTIVTLINNKRKVTNEKR